MNNLTTPSPLSLPSVLPLLSVEEIAQSPALIVAPHPDDETLGCGGAIALLRSLGCDVRVLVISDGTKSHPRSKKFSADALKALRESETLEAMALLGVDKSAVTFLGLKDGSVTAQHTNAVSVCHSYLAQVNPQIIFSPVRSDPHPDHRASWSLIDTATRHLQYQPRVIEYPIWDWDLSQRGNLPENIKPWRLDISPVVELKQKAIAVYRSQTTKLIDDDPEAFILTPEMLANFAHPWEVYLIK